MFKYLLYYRSKLQTPNISSTTLVTLWIVCVFAYKTNKKTSFDLKCPFFFVLFLTSFSLSIRCDMRPVFTQHTLIYALGPVVCPLHWRDRRGRNELGDDEKTWRFYDLTPSGASQIVWCWKAMTGSQETQTLGLCVSSLWREQGSLSIAGPPVITFHSWACEQRMVY